MSAKNDRWESMTVLISKRTNDVDIYFMVCLMRDREKEGPSIEEPIMCLCVCVTGSHADRKLEQSRQKQARLKTECSATHQDLRVCS